MLRRLMMAGGGGSGGDPYFAQVGYLLHGEGANNGTVFTDSGPNAFSVTRAGIAGGGIVTSTAHSKFGAASIFSPTDADNRLQVPSSPASRGSGGSWTWEAAIYRTVSGSNQVLFDGNNLLSNTTGPALYIDSSDKLAVYDGFASANRGGGGSSVVSGSWVWIAVTYDGSSLRFYYNGVLEQTVGTFSNVWSNSSDVSLLADQFGPSQCFRGYIDEIRFTRVARYTGASYTLPAAPFPNS